MRADTRSDGAFTSSNLEGRSMSFTRRSAWETRRQWYSSCTPVSICRQSQGWYRRHEHSTRPSQHWDAFRSYNSKEMKVMKRLMSTWTDWNGAKQPTANEMRSVMEVTVIETAASENASFMRHSNGADRGVERHADKLINTLSTPTAEISSFTHCFT